VLVDVLVLRKGLRAGRRGEFCGFKETGIARKASASKSGFGSFLFAKIRNSSAYATFPFFHRFLLILDPIVRSSTLSKTKLPQR
jgi:hypothetical protein